MSEPELPPQPREDAAAAGEGTPSAVATTAARALALGAAITAPAALIGLHADLVSIGILRRPSPWGSWSTRIEDLDQSDRVLARFDSLDDVRAREADRQYAGALLDDMAVPGLSARADLWREASRTGSRASAIAWLRLLMADREPVTAAAAAVSLSAWQAPKDRQIPEALVAARNTARAYVDSASAEARQIAMAGRRGLDEPARLDRVNRGARSEPGGTSLLVHGTAAYAGSWWFTGGDFHTYIREHIRTDVYAGRNPFAWSGAYRGSHRAIAAERLAGWAADTADGWLNSVFAHSYGGVIALSATTHGLRMNELILLSTPVEGHPVEWRNIGRTVSLRIHLDLVLLAARRRQRFTENVEEHVLPRWFWHHGDSHNPGTWQEYGCAKRLKLL